MGTTRFYGETMRIRMNNSLLFPVNVHEGGGRNARKARRYWLKYISRAGRIFKIPDKFPVSREFVPALELARSRCRGIAPPLPPLDGGGGKIGVLLERHAMRAVRTSQG